MKGDCRHRASGGGYFFANVKLTFATRKKKEEVFFQPLPYFDLLIFSSGNWKKGKGGSWISSPLFPARWLRYCRKSFAAQFD